MRKAGSLLLVLCLVFLLSACGDKNSTTDNDTGSSTTQSQTNEADTSATEQFSDITDSTTYNSDTDGNDVPSSTTSTPATTTKPETSKPITTTKPETSKPNTTTHTHSYSDATCTEPAKCSCGAVKGKALSHSYGNATCTEPKTCTRCGETQGNELGHNFSGGVCARCGKKLVAEAHGFSVGDTTPASNADGESYTLTYLGEDLWEDQNGHIWTSYEHEDGTMHWSSIFG